MTTLNVTYSNIESTLYGARTDANPQPETPSAPKPQTENANSQPKKNSQTQTNSSPIQKTWFSNIEDSSGNLYYAWQLSVRNFANEERVLQILRQSQALHTVYRLRDDDLAEMLGEAVFSESADEIRLHGIFVKPEHRRKGHGATLMEAIISLGDFKTITLCTGLGNIGFFRRFGFEVVEIGSSLVSMERKT